jgi:galactonate dehydratase
MSARKHCRVTRVDTYVVGTRWCNWVFAQVLTDDGIAGIGEGTCEWQPKAVEAAIAQLAQRWVIGSSAFEIEAFLPLWSEDWRKRF